MAMKFLASMPSARLRLMLKLAGLVILLAGYFIAGIIWQGQARLDQQAAELDANPEAPLSTLDSRKGVQQAELYYGKSGVLMENLAGWFRSLTHGRGLAKTIIVLSSIAAIGCFLVARNRAFFRA
jgi:amino acid transporter